MLSVRYFIQVSVCDYVRHTYIQTNKRTSQFHPVGSQPREERNFNNTCGAGLNTFYDTTAKREEAIMYIIIQSTNDETHHNYDDDRLHHYDKTAGGETEFCA